jgi:peptidoglycan/xylan/chitin deacetylase (PgdA/CDA1 family)
MSPRPVPVLCYHSVSEGGDPRFAEWALTPDLFDDHMRFLAENHYRTLTVRDLAERVFERREPLDDRTVVITFDDGLADFYTDAWPCLRRYSHSVTLFVATSFVGGTSTWLADLGEADRPMLTWSQVRELSEAGVECGAHGHEHVQMDLLSAPRAWAEITRSRDALEPVVGRPVSFAYPHGYYTGRLERQVAEAGFASACAVKQAISSTDDDRYAIARVLIMADTTVERLAEIVNGHGVEVAPGPRRLRRGAWRVARRAGAEPLLARVRSRRASAGAEDAR